MTEDPTTRFQRALLDALDRPGHRHDDLWTALTADAEEARSRGVLAEQFLVQIKDLWECSVRDTGGGEDEPMMQRLKQDIVTRAIKAYYLQ